MNNYPWEATPKGFGFFIPTLDPKALRVEALIDSQRYPVKYKAHAGVINNTLGVLFVRTA